MKVAQTEADLSSALSTARSEAKAAFGDDAVYLEKYLQVPRHIEIQVLGDGKGRAIHLGERDCSLQRRHQKVLEESPSPALNVAARDEIGGIVAAAMRELKYLGVGTVEFLFEDGKFYFIEMNTRIQVEHPVTEMVTGIDLVQAQLRIASGEKLSDILPAKIEMRGHAIECRINAEHPEKFTPSAGKITAFNVPGGFGVRVDTAQYSEGVVPPYYDSMIGKLIVHARNRQEAIHKMVRALDQFVVQGIFTTIPLHKQIMLDEDFQAGHFDTKFMERFFEKQKSKSA
jgi:acetyl-CoA carboxylase biotin carboxylase subunit